MDDLTLTTVGSALITSLLLQWLKKSTWFPFLGIEHKFQNINLIVSVIVSGLVSLGVGYNYDKNTGDLHLIISTHQAWHWLIQWCSQHATYKTMVVPTELQAAILNKIKELDLNNTRGEE